jgi:hypothetical protein
LSIGSVDVCIGIRPANEQPLRQPLDAAAVNQWTAVDMKADWIKVFAFEILKSKR